MVAIRACVRRGLAFHAKFLPLIDGLERAQITIWIVDHVRTEGVHKLGTLTIPHKRHVGKEDASWLYMLPRLLTASRCHESVDADENVVFFGPDVPESEFHEESPICDQVKLCAELVLHNSGAEKTEGWDDITVQLRKVIEGLVTRFWQQEYFKDPNRQSLTWTLPMVKTCPGIIDSSIRAQTVHTLVPQNIRMEIVRVKTGRIDAMEWRSNVEGDDTTVMLTALRDLDACARETSRVNPEGPSHSHLLKASRIIGFVPHDEVNDADSLLHTYLKWLDGTLLFFALTALPASQKPAHQEDINRSSATYGCHYSSSWQGASRDRDAVDGGVTDEKPCNDIYMFCDGTDREECAREIFGIFVLTLASLLKPLEEFDLYEEVVYAGSSTSVARHRILDRMVELMIQKAPSLFPTKKKAREMIIPAFIKHSLLPSMKEKLATPSLGSSEVASPL
ncbi:hypothetical protein HBI81_173530 [Parastagonospora nodorum]|nr:hypothetical protein HBH52_198950 [Parastagonospora nodorum]KAH3977913.1 hypothetical protein HBH51_071780 [Parastagonospora nodorum]KAH4183784.1 hypothetical protein HBH42_199100 [Parastagonospora nodorum]KAH4291723.1 hypothetical protein HBI01_187120 [Parastagonospora nodorum]KAH4292692.1 hypothetical protein HBI02_190200 [Parastagonospora nodorum]